MVKIIAFDFVGVLVNEKDIELSLIEDKLERMFGPNLDDTSYLKKARKMIENDSIIIHTTEALIDKLYKVRDKELFKKIKEKYSGCKIIVATNHLSYVRNFIEKYLDIAYVDDLIISAEINKIKLNRDFYEYLLEKFNIESFELLFLDDNSENVESAKNLGIHTIKVTKDMNLFNEICSYLDNLLER